MQIQGPKQPGKDIQLYLGLLTEELATLWDTPPNTWEAVAQDYFPMRAAVVTMVHAVAGMSQGRWSTDTVSPFGAWMTQRITSYRKIPILQKPCSLGIEGGFARMTSGENAKICSMVNLISKMPHV
jgi:hypothetical protein